MVEIEFLSEVGKYMSCPFSTSEVYNEVNCSARDDSVQCPFADECNQTMMWDTISKYIRIGIQTYELAKELKK